MGMGGLLCQLLAQEHLQPEICADDIRKLDRLHSNRP